MAGRKNHILPKLILRGFTVDPQKKPEQVFVFKNGKNPFLSSLDKIGAERDYYKLNGSTFIDDKMTIDEERYGSTINRIRSTHEIESGDNILMNDFAFDLYTRSKSFVKELERTFIELVRCVSSDEHSEKLIELSMQRAIENTKTKTLSKITRDSIIKYGPNKAKAVIPSAKKQMLLFLDSQYFHETAKSALQNILPLIKEQITTKIGASVKLGQLQTLTDRYTEPHKYLKFNFKWSLSNQNERPIILGDVGPLFVSSAGITSLLWVKGKIDAVYLPLSSNIIAIGSIESSDETIQIEEINNASALYSNDFFVASEKNEITLLLSKRIGENNRHLQAVDNSITDWLGEQISNLSTPTN